MKHTNRKSLGAVERERERVRLLRNKGLLLMCQKLNNTQGVFSLFSSNYIKRQTI